MRILVPDCIITKFLSSSCYVTEVQITKEFTSTFERKLHSALIKCITYTFLEFTSNRRLFRGFLM